MSTIDDDYDSNTSIGPIKKNFKGFTYKAMNYYTCNSKTCNLSGSTKSDFDHEHRRNDTFNIWDNKLPNSVNKYGIKVIITGKRIKHRYSHNHCSALRCGCIFRDKRSQKDENKEFQSIVKEAYYEDDSD